MGWLFLAQHYGLPTRLLDWSESPVIALYFAVANIMHDEDDGCLWALLGSPFNGDMIGQNALVVLEETVVQDMVKQAFGHRDVESPPEALAIPAREIDQRMLIQQARFTMHSTGRDLADIANSKAWLRKFVVPAKAKKTVRARLSFIGLRPSTLFPDLPTLAAELKAREFMGADP
jgi:hypothetical protein